MNSSNAFKTVLASAAGIALLAGCGGTSAPTQTDTPAAPATTATTAPSPAGSATASIPASAKGTVPASTDPTVFAAGTVAINTAELAVPNSRAISIDLNDDGTWTVEVIEGTTEHEIDLSADGAQVLGHEQDDADSDDIARLEQASVPLAEAIAQALATVSDPVFDDAELDGNGRVFWKIDLDQPDVDVYVDARTGEVFNA